MKKKNVIGVDVSKETLDLVFQNNSRHIQISNDLKGFKLFVKQTNEMEILLSDCLVVMEHTGIYSYPFENFLSEHSIAFTKVPALRIKRSSGIVRGKSDKSDAKMIAEFGYKEQDTLNPFICSKNINYLKSLLSLRDRLISQRAGYEVTLKEQINFHSIKKNCPLIKSQKKVITVLEKEIEEIDAEIKKVMDQEESFKKNYDLLVSITGVGFVVASYMIVYTNNFTLFKDARKFASYCGVAPFDNRSGKMKRPSRISHLANKNIKRLLDLAAKSAINFDSELKMFYERRVQNGKNKMSTINIVRNKLLYRMFAVIKRQGPFQKNYQQVA